LVSMLLKKSGKPMTVRKDGHGFGAMPLLPKNSMRLTRLWWGAKRTVDQTRE
jgi:hypothetical protein